MVDDDEFTFPGQADLLRSVAELRARLPSELAALAGIAHDLRWSWTDDGSRLFEDIDADRWRRVGQNPVRFLREVKTEMLDRAAGNSSLVSRAAAVAEELTAERRRAAAAGSADPHRPVAFLCAEFGIHQSLPVYSGGLGVLAGDIVKAASDLAVPLVGVGLLYRNGYFHQRIDPSGMQHEYWLDTDPELTACVQVTDDDGSPLTITVPLGSEDLAVHVWRVDVGRVPLYLLDSDVESNSTVGRWVTSRLYESNPRIRLAQYAVLGVGAARALQAMGIEPSVFHLNEGHPSLVAAELMHREVSAGVDREEAWARVRRRLVFTTHTPVPAGNETYDIGEFLDVLGPVADLTGDREEMISLSRLEPDDPHDRPGLTAFALRTARSANGVSRRHGEVARVMWRPLFGSAENDQVPITHVTNGVHVPTWLQSPMRELLDRHLGHGWRARSHEPEAWDGVEEIPDEEIWAVRCEARSRFLTWLRRQATEDRLRRGEDPSYASAAEHGFNDDRLTIGFARRLATYKRLYLLSLRPDRALDLLSADERGIQFVFAGKAHPADEGAKAIVRDLFDLKHDPRVGARVAFVEDYDLSSAAEMVAGCDVWVNLPRPPQEASGTSGMKSVLNGGLQLSVLDGWWAEAYEEGNGWAIDGTVADDPEAQDREHADALFDLLTGEVVPSFHDRDANGIPRRWVAMIKASLRTNGPRFSAARMVSDYAGRIYPQS